MSNILISVGCDVYDEPDYGDLSRAEQDATRIFGSLTGSDGGYDANLSRLLLSPNVDQLRETLEDLFDLVPIQVLTFFFAGHGEVKQGYYYLCPRNARPDRLSATALSLADLFTKLGELRPRQANVVMDSCESGGAMLDMSNLLKAELVTGPDSPSIAFLAACAPDEEAYEDVAGGSATSALLRYLDGDVMLQESRPFFDLVEIGRAVSAEVSSADPLQTPVTWGLNLYGQGEFAKNPFFSGGIPGLPPPPVGIAPGTPIGAKIREYSEGIWHHYQSIVRDPSYADLVELLGAVCEDIVEAKVSPRPFVRGIATGLRGRTLISSDCWPSRTCSSAARSRSCLTWTKRRQEPLRANCLRSGVRWTRR